METLLETTGVIFGLFSVWYAVREHNATWWTGTVNSILFGILFFRARYYVNVILQVIYVFYNLYGAYMWRYGGRNRTAPVIALTPARAWGVMVAAGVAATWLVGRLFAAYTDNPQPYWDAITVGLSLVAQYMLARKWLENWWVWIASNVIYFGLCFAAALYQVAGLQVVYILLSVMGYLAWRKDWRALAGQAASLPVE